jgi:23S rRNA pseudouridine1911/1915/1917 synthase
MHDGGAVIVGWMDRDRVFHVREALDGQTLATAVKRLAGVGVSWNEANRLVAKRHVTVNGNLCMDGARRLKEGEVIHVFAHARTPLPTEKDVGVIFQDDDLIVIDKPAGVTTLRHAEERGWDKRRKQKQRTLDELVRTMVGGGGGGAAAKGRRAARPVRVRPVHRLDRDTSGLMIFALSARAEQALVAMFKGHSIERVYRAVVIGEAGERTIESWLLRDRGDGLRGSSPRGKDDPDGSHAVTHVKSLGQITAGDSSIYTLVECRLETGRTHQIRIHLAESGHMICGEKVYLRAAPGKPATADKSGAPRQALHSADLEFVHPISGKRLKFASPWPKDLSAWMAKLERK